MRARLAILFAGSIALGGCAYGYGGYGPYGGYGGSRVSVGVSYGSGYGGYGGYGYGYPGYNYGYGYGGYGSPYWGWYGDYYYPGTGYYVYDRYRRPYRWNDRQRRYWSERRHRVLNTTRTADRPAIRENWSDFERRDDRRERPRNRAMRTQRD